METKYQRSSGQYEIGPFSARDLKLVDAEAPPAFDTITRLVSTYFGTAVALISIVEEENDCQFFTSQCGLKEPWRSLRQTPLSHSFCQHVKRASQPLVVKNARDHPLVKDNLAIRDMQAIAYLGAPIRGPEGDCIGALCVVESIERNWSDLDVVILSDFADCVSDEILLRAKMLESAERQRILHLMHERTQRYSALRESVSLAFMAPDLSVEERFTELLRSTCTAFGFDTGAIAKIECDCADVLIGYSAVPDTDWSTAQALDGSLAEVAASGQDIMRFQDLATGTSCRRHDLSGRVPGAVVGIPLILSGVLFGVLEFSCAEPRSRDWSEEEISVLSMVSLIAAANLGVLGQIDRLKRSESALLHFVTERNRVPAGA